MKKSCIHHCKECIAPDTIIYFWSISHIERQILSNIQCRVRPKAKAICVALQCFIHYLLKLSMFPKCCLPHYNEHENVFFGCKLTLSYLYSSPLFKWYVSSNFQKISDNVKGYNRTLILRLHNTKEQEINNLVTVIKCMIFFKYHAAGWMFYLTQMW